MLFAMNTYNTDSSFGSEWMDDCIENEYIFHLLNGWAFKNTLEKYLESGIMQRKVWKTSIKA